jgi:hypothetical protein
MCRISSSSVPIFAVVALVSNGCSWEVKPKTETAISLEQVYLLGVPEQLRKDARPISKSESVDGRGYLAWKSFELTIRSVDMTWLSENLLKAAVREADEKRLGYSVENRTSPSLFRIELTSTNNEWKGTIRGVLTEVGKRSNGRICVRVDLRYEETRVSVSTVEERRA